MFGDLLTIIFSGLLLYLLSGLVLPWILNKKIGLPDGGWGFGRIAGWLIIGAPIWTIAHLGIPINTKPGVWLLIVALAVASAFYAQKHWVKIKNQIIASKPYIITQEILFWFGYIFLGLIRGFNPDVNGLEKFMDHGFMEGYLRSPTLPANDMWLTGLNVNYYTFGHFQGSIMMRVWGLLPEISYNLLLALILGLVLSQSFQFITALITFTRKTSLKSTIMGGVIGSILVAFAANTQPIWYFLTHHTWQGFWYPDATRFIPNTIHEFPAYSFIVSDLHGHVWNLAQVLALITLIMLWFRQMFREREETDFGKLLKKLGPWAIVIGSLVGLMASTSTWAVMVYGIFLCISGAGTFISQRKLKIHGLFISAFLIGIFAALTAAPWFFHFQSISEGIVWVSERSPIHDFLVLWTGQILVSGLATATIFKLYPKAKEEEKSGLLFGIYMFITAMILLILPELIYFKDIYPTHPRANTMFKFTFQAFILMYLLIGWLVGILSSLPKNLWKKIVLGASLLLIIAVISYPYFGFRDFYGLKQYKGLNGLTWLKEMNPNDYAAIKWLKENTTGRPVVLEAVGESYTTFARVSTFTGLPTVLGWRVHEWLWRGSFDIPGERTGEVEQMYLEPLSYASQVKFNEYNVEYVFVGDKEREAYPQINLNQLRQLGQVVFERGDTFIVHRTGAVQNLNQSSR